MIAYLPSFIIGDARVSKHALIPHDMTKEEVDSLLTDEKEIEGDPPGTIADVDLLKESMNYNPGITPAVTHQYDHDITDISDLDSHGDESLLKTEEDIDEPVIDISDDFAVKYVPSEIIDYFSEAAMKAKERNALPDSEFGIPRLRAYPLNDEKHVRQAIRMFGHCKDPKDKKTLANRIFAKVDEFGMEVKIGKNNPLYEYAPKALQEASLAGTDDLPPYDPKETKLGRRSREDIIKEHLRKNNLFYDNIFYNGEYANALKAASRYDFLDFFYPDTKHCTWTIRKYSVLGAMAQDEELFKHYGLTFEPDVVPKYPEQPDSDDLANDILASYDRSSNWFDQDLSNDLDHVWYCMKLYTLISYLLNSKVITLDNLDSRWNGLMGDWMQRVIYHYDLMSDAEEDSKEYFRECQYLYDLCWSFCDNPLDDHVAISNIISFVYHMASCKDLVDMINEGTELVSKTDLAAYLVNDLGMPDDIFLLPDTLEYPILSKKSVKMAMDIISRIDKDNIPTYTKNLNKKYKELGCDFHITIDHPYAKYADKYMINNMTQVLIEGDTLVADNSDTEADISSEPWFKKVSEIEFNGDSFYPDREIGPNKREPIKDWTRTDSVL